MIKYCTMSTADGPKSNHIPPLKGRVYVCPEEVKASLLTTHFNMIPNEVTNKPRFVTRLTQITAIFLKMVRVLHGLGGWLVTDGV